MRKYIVLAVLAVFSLYMFGCAKKESGNEEYQEAMSMDTLGGVASPMQPAVSDTAKASESKAVSAAAAPATGAVKLEALPPAGPYKPSIREIQAALKTANYYRGEVDGKTGKMTKKAIEEFQKANGLEADGKVGPKTWGLLSKYLSQSPVSQEKK